MLSPSFRRVWAPSCCFPPPSCQLYVSVDVLTPCSGDLHVLTDACSGLGFAHWCVGVCWAPGLDTEPSTTGNTGKETLPFIVFLKQPPLAS